MNAYSKKVVFLVFCLLLSGLIYKFEVLDYKWQTIHRDPMGYIDGWNSPLEAIRNKWDMEYWDIQIISEDAFRVRPKVNPISGYLVPSTFSLIGVFVVLFFQGLKHFCEPLLSNGQ